jgi:hypothetical protein
MLYCLYKHKKQHQELYGFSNIIYSHIISIFSYNIYYTPRTIWFQQYYIFSYNIYSHIIYILIFSKKSHVVSSRLLAHFLYIYLFLVNVIFWAKKYLKKKIKNIQTETEYYSLHACNFTSVCEQALRIFALSQFEKS